MQIGSIVELIVPCLSNPIGSKGIVFAEYADFDIKNKKGYQIIFENGETDGFSVTEQKTLLREIGFNKKYSDYKFNNIIKTSMAFDDGFFDFYCDYKWLRKEKLKKINNVGNL